MIKKIFLIILTFTVLLFAQYNFEFTCLDDTVKNAGFNDYIVFFFRLENTGSIQDIYEFNCTIIDSVPGWFVTYCVGGVCVEPGVIIYDTLAAGEMTEDIEVNVYTDTTEGTEAVNLRVASMGNPTLRDSINVYVNVQTGIEEKYEFVNAEIRKPILRLYPNPFSEEINIEYSMRQSVPSSMGENLHSSLVDSPRVNGPRLDGTESIELKIYNATGRLIKELKDLTNHQSTVHWDGRDYSGRKVSSGIYFVSLETEVHRETRKIIMVE